MKLVSCFWQVSGSLVCLKPGGLSQLVKRLSFEFRKLELVGGLKGGLKARIMGQRILKIGLLLFSLVRETRKG